MRLLSINNLTALMYICVYMYVCVYMYKCVWRVQIPLSVVWIFFSKMNIFISLVCRFSNFLFKEKVIFIVIKVK